jgi:hypothetical protein
MRFLFWNIQEKPNHGSVAQLTVDHDLDILVLAEARSQVSPLLTALNPNGSAEFHVIESLGCERLNIFARFPARFAHICYETPRVTVQHFSPPGIESFLLVGVHMPSKLHADEKDQAGHCEDLAQDIAEVEDEIGHTRTILVGDVNQNPFEEGMISAKGLHAVMSADIARRGSREFNHKTYRMFYNPMWGRFGDTTSGPPGTYFHASAKKCETFWHILDLVLIRPVLISRFQHNSLQILAEHSEGSFLSSNGRPSRTVASDHLPLLFEVSM